MPKRFLCPSRSFSRPYFHPCFRPALPSDRRQIRRLLQNYHRQDGVGSISGLLGSKLLAGLGLCGLLTASGTLGLLYALAIMIAVYISRWLSLGLFGVWQNYWVFEQNHRLVACCKLISYNTYAVLSDVVVLPKQRCQGIGTFLVRSAVHQITQPVYLACLPERLLFYQRLKFTPAASSSLTVHLKYVLGLDLDANLKVLVKDGPETKGNLQTHR